MADTINALLHVPSLLTLFITTHAPIAANLLYALQSKSLLPTLFTVTLGLTQGRDNQLNSPDHSEYHKTLYSITSTI